MRTLNLTILDARDNPTQLISAAGWIYADSGSFQPFEGYTGPLDVSLAGDVNGNGYQDIVIGAGEGGGPRVTVLDTHTRATLANFFAFEPSFRGGVSVAVDGAEGRLLVGAGRGGAPVVATYDLANFREIGRRYYGPQDYRGGIQLDAEAIGRESLPNITLGNGRFPIYLDLKGLPAMEVTSITNQVYDQLAPLADLVRVVTVEPSDYPSNYLTASAANLGYFPIPVTGLATSVITNRQPDSYVRQEVFADQDTNLDHMATVLAHEIGHFFGLAHDEDITNIMHAPTVVGTTFTAEQYGIMRANLERWS